MSDGPERDADGRFAGFGALPLNVVVRVGSARCRLGELTELEPGRVIDLDRRVGEPFELLAEGLPLARVELVSHGEGIAVKLISAVEEDVDPGA